jgi:predicted transcriptional regulator with HTH domain
VNSLFHGLNYLFNFFWLKSTLIHLIKFLTKTFSNVPTLSFKIFGIFYDIYPERDYLKEIANSLGISITTVSKALKIILMLVIKLKSCIVLAESLIIRQTVLQ